MMTSLDHLDDEKWRLEQLAVEAAIKETEMIMKGVIRQGQQFVPMNAVKKILT